MKIPFTKKNIIEIKTEPAEKFGKDEGAFDIRIKGGELKKTVDKIFGRSLFVRLVDSGSCNACENELSLLASPYYDIERFGIKFVASPRHADILLITGCMTRNMFNPVWNVYNSMPDPKLVITAGDCQGENPYFGESYSIMGPAGKWLPVAMHIKGCPPA